MEEDYQEKIIELVKNIHNQKFLKFLYETICAFKKKWGI